MEERTWWVKTMHLRVPSLPRSSILVFITFLLLGEPGETFFALSLFTQISGALLCNFSVDDFPVLVHLLITDKSFGGWKTFFSVTLSSLTNGLISTGKSKFKATFSNDFLSFCLESLDDSLLGTSGDAKLMTSSSSSEKSKTTFLFLLDDLLKATLWLSSSSLSPSTASWAQVWPFSTTSEGFNYVSKNIGDAMLHNYCYHNYNHREGFENS